MTQIALFHSVLGLRQGMHAAAERLRSAGHEVLLVDQYDGQVFCDYSEADAFAQSLGYPELMRRAVVAVENLPDGFVAAGFSNGGGMAQYVATQRRTAGVLMLSGALPLHMLGSEGWPAGLPAQIHYSQDDPFRQQEWVTWLSRQSTMPMLLWKSSTTPAVDTYSPMPPCPLSTCPKQQNSYGNAF